MNVIQIPPCGARVPPPVDLKVSLSEIETKRFTQLGFPLSVCLSHPDFVRFLLDSGLAYQIAMFKNTTAQGAVNHGVQCASDGHPQIKIEGRWQRWEDIQKLIEYDASQECVIAKRQPSVKYNYISPDGLVPKDPAADQIYPVEVLSPEEYAQLKKHAGKFWKTNQEIDPGQSKEYVLQIVATTRDICKRNWFTENLLENAPEHVYTRLVDKNGKVYSFGLKMPATEHKQIFKKVLFNIAKTCKTSVTSPDYEESRKFDQRIVTSIPLTQKRFKEIFDFIGQANKEGIRFNYGRQNCTKFNQILLMKAGVRVNTRMRLTTGLRLMLPSPSRLPVINSLVWITRKMGRIFGKIMQKIYQSCPKVLQRCISKIGRGLRFICRKINALFSNLIGLMLGAKKMTSPLEKSKKHNAKICDYELTHFEKLFNKPSDIFNEDLMDLYHSRKIIEWQLQQHSTNIHKFDRTRMYILP